MAVMFMFLICQCPGPAAIIAQTAQDDARLTTGQCYNQGILKGEVSLYH
jgi:hypothetical protein